MITATRIAIVAVALLLLYAVLSGQAGQIFHAARQGRPIK